MLSDPKLNYSVSENFKRVKLWFLIPPFLLLLFIYLYFAFFHDGNTFTVEYVKVQTDLFFYLNHRLSTFPNLEFNLIQIGDVIIVFPLLTALIIYAPKLWEALLISSIISLIVAAILKKIFAIPRPAAVLNHDSFTIVGDTLSGRNSLPSGHSITMFIIFTILWAAFIPKKNKIVWGIFMLLVGLFIAFSRVGVGAHYPLDVITGSTIGIILGIVGIRISHFINWFAWLRHKKLYPIFMLVLVIWGVVIVQKIMALNLAIFYISLLSLIVSLYLMATYYAKKTY
ncbi:MAG: phosphatase PAP2 family protein [Sphingobacteriales bacterium]|nr:phosphatase PAP2 family protein [Sphingobacteriales bacterium]